MEGGAITGVESPKGGLGIVLTLGSGGWEGKRILGISSAVL
jgi:hypothetical protein